jgi:2-polyprenyl-6-hydroxyphenyl methylase/3-demethylubiquinone-9 3-methyltransferase
MALRTTPVHGADDIRAFFDRLAPSYRDCHGRADQLLRYRLGVIERLLGGAERGFLVEIGCGTGLHLFALAESFRRAHGTDLSPGMIRQAERLRRVHPAAGRITFSVDPAESLASVGDGEADVALCVGALEHIPDPAAALRQVRRVLRPSGAFVCLTPNADYLWYARLAPWLGLPTRHLSTDRFLRRAELEPLLAAAGLKAEAVDYWTFIPRGDLPGWLALLLDMLDAAGRLLRVPGWRGGLCFRVARA